MLLGFGDMIAIRAASMLLKIHDFNPQNGDFDAKQPHAVIPFFYVVATAYCIIDIRIYKPRLRNVYIYCIYIYR